MMKKFICLFTIIILILGLSFSALSACSSTDDGKLKIVVTIFPIYDWVNELLGDKADQATVTLLLDSGADLHSYQPSVSDMVAVAEADLFIYIGGESDEWVEKALKNATNKNRRTMNLLSLLGDRAQIEKIVEGMERPHEEDVGDSAREEKEETEYDEHVWLSLKNAAFYVDLICKELSAIDPENADAYAESAANYLRSLNALDAEYQAVAEDSPRDTILFGDRFPFRYLVEDYGLKYYAAFVGCSAETNASVQTMTFLTNKTNELDLKVIFKLENSNGEIAEEIKRESRAKNQEILILDSLQSATKKEYKNGRDYLSVMRSNLDALRRALEA